MTDADPSLARCYHRRTVWIRRVFGSAGVTLLLGLALGCSKAEKLPRSCRFDIDCSQAGNGAGSGDDGGTTFCVSGQCTDVCAGIVGGQPCNVGFVTAGPGPLCCGDGSKCCPDGFEHKGCYPADSPCPTSCRSFSRWCGGTQTCRYSSVEGDRQAWGCPGNSDVSSRYSCVDSCAPEATCGRECCGTGTSCVDGCCAVVPGDDGGSPPPDGSGAD